MFEINKIYNADCLEFMKQIPGNTIDCIITSPPYNLGNIHHTGNKRHTPYFDDMPENEYQSWQIKVLNEMSRIIKNTGNIFYNHKNRIKNGFTISPLFWIFKTNLFLKQEIVWETGSQNFDKIRFYPFTERIYWLSKSNTTINNTLSLSDIFPKKQINVEGTSGEHKRAFPVKLVEKILVVSTKENDLILDCFSGSGTTAIACSELKRNFICIEKDKQYYEASCKRLEEYNKQLKLF